MKKLLPIIPLVLAGFALVACETSPSAGTSDTEGYSDGPPVGVSTPTPISPETGSGSY